MHNNIQLLREGRDGFSSNVTQFFIWFLSCIYTLIAKNHLMLNYFRTLHSQNYTNILIAGSLHTCGTSPLEKSNILAACCFVFTMVRFWNDFPLSVVIIWNKRLMCKGHRLARQTDKLTCE